MAKTKVRSDGLLHITCYFVCHLTLRCREQKKWAGQSKAAVGNHYYRKECLDIHLFKAAAHEAVARSGSVC